MASARRRCCHGRTPGDGRNLSTSSGHRSLTCSPERIQGNIQKFTHIATYCHHLPVSEPASLEEQVAAGHSPDLARLLQPAMAPRAA